MVSSNRIVFDIHSLSSLEMLLRIFLLINEIFMLKIDNVMSLTKVDENCP